MNLNDILSAEKSFINYYWPTKSDSDVIFCLQLLIYSTMLHVKH